MRMGGSRVIGRGICLENVRLHEEKKQFYAVYYRVQSTVNMSKSILRAGVHGWVCVRSMCL